MHLQLLLVAAGLLVVHAGYVPAADHHGGYAPAHGVYPSAIAPPAPAPYHPPHHPPHHKPPHHDGGGYGKKRHRGKFIHRSSSSGSSSSSTDDSFGSHFDKSKFGDFDNSHDNEFGIGRALGESKR